MAAKIDMIGVFVSDLHRMVAFYRDILGFQIEWDGNGPYAEFKHEGVRFSMYQRSELPALLGAEPTFPDGLNGTFELAVASPISTMSMRSSSDWFPEAPRPSTSQGTSPGECGPP